MVQQGQVFKLKTRGADGKPMWVYRYRVDGRRSARPQVGGFVSQGEALQALQVALERLHRRDGRLAQVKLRGFLRRARPRVWRAVRTGGVRLWRAEQVEACCRRLGEDGSRWSGR